MTPAEARLWTITTRDILDYSRHEVLVDGDDYQGSCCQCSTPLEHNYSSAVRHNGRLYCISCLPEC